MTDTNMPDVLDRLKDACVGHPYAKIPWPHRLLHDAIAEIEKLRKDLCTQSAVKCDVDFLKGELTADALHLCASQEKTSAYEIVCLVLDALVERRFLPTPPKDGR